MRDRYLEITFRKGKMLAAYLYLPRVIGAKSARTEEVGPGLLASSHRRDVDLQRIWLLMCLQPCG